MINTLTYCIGCKERYYSFNADKEVCSKLHLSGSDKFIIEYPKSNEEFISNFVTFISEDISPLECPLKKKKMKKKKMI